MVFAYRAWRIVRAFDVAHVERRSVGTTLHHGRRAFAVGRSDEFDCVVFAVLRVLKFAVVRVTTANSD